MAALIPPRQFTMVPGQEIDSLFLCPICQDSWADPVELVPCGDIFCQSCINAARAQHAAQPMIMENFQCPQCHTVVQSEKKPNRMLLNTVLEVEVECCYCHWRGTREASSHHECEEGKQHKAAEAAAAPTSTPLLQQQQQQQSPDVQLSSSTAPAPSKAHAPRRVSGTASPSTGSGSAAVSSPPGLRGPRRAVQEIEGAFTVIEDDPTSTILRTRAESTSPAVSYDYGFGNARSSSGVAGIAAGNSLSGTGNDFGGTRDAVLTSPLNPVLPAPRSPPSSSTGPAVQPAPGSNPSFSASASHASEPWRRYRLSQVEYDQLVGIFMMYDDGTGRLNHQQLRDLCFCMNFVQREDDVTVIFRAMDNARKGYVSQDDFLLWLSTHRPDPSALFGLTQFEYTDAILQFRSVDPEFNGVIDANDFCAICLTNNYAKTPDEAMRFFHLCDERHTGYVSLQQYLRMLKTIKGAGDGNGGNGGGGGGGGPRRTTSQLQQHPQAAMGRVVAGSSASAQSPVGVNTPLRTAGSSGSGQGGLHTSGGNTDNSFGFSPQGSDYWANDTPRGPPQPAPPAQQNYRQQSSMFDYYPPAATGGGGGGGGAAAGPPPPTQRFVTSLNSFPGDVAHQQQLQQQRQQVMQQQPYSQMGRSTTPASPQVVAAPMAGGQQTGSQHLRSRLHRPSARPQRDEECSVM